MAVAHYTTMLCAQKTALPVTQSLLDEMNAFLAENSAEPLEVVGDTRDFLKDDDGALISDTGSREVWYKVYRTALDNVKNGDWRISELALAHNGTWNGGSTISFSTSSSLTIVSSTTTPRRKSGLSSRKS